MSAAAASLPLPEREGQGAGPVFKASLTHTLSQRERAYLIQCSISGTVNSGCRRFSTDTGVESMAMYAQAHHNTFGSGAMRAACCVCCCSRRLRRARRVSAD